MQVGDVLLTEKNRWVKVLSINPLDEQTVYNFTVASDHDYFVGKSGLLVHNLACSTLAQNLEDAVRTGPR